MEHEVKSLTHKDVFWIGGRFILKLDKKDRCQIAMVKL